MKTIILFLSLVLSASAATLYPVLTDNSGRTFTGGATNLALLSATNQTFVGTNTFNTNTILGTEKLQDTLDAKASAANLVTVSNAQVTTDGKLAGYVTNLGGLATNLSAVGLTVTGQTNTDLTVSRVVVTDANKKLTSSSATATEAGYLSGVTSAIQTQLDAKPTVALTNISLLNTSQAFTGTPTFPATVLVSNAITERLLFYTNLYIASFASNANDANLTNAGGFAFGTPAFTVTMPALLSTNSQVRYDYVTQQTNATANFGLMYFYVGPNTNFIAQRQTWASSVARTFVPHAIMFYNDGAYTNQFNTTVSTPVVPPTTSTTGVNLVDTSSPWVLRACVSTVGSFTNGFLRLRIYEVIP